MTKKHVSLLVVFVLLFTTLFSSFVFAADDEWVVADEITINVKAHIQTHGDKVYSDKGMIAFGTFGEAKRLEEFTITLDGAPEGMELRAMAHVQSFGDIPATGLKAGIVGTHGLAKRIEGVAFGLYKEGTDTLYPGYRVKYAVHMQSFGWGVSKEVNEVVGKNFKEYDSMVVGPDFAGTKGLSKRIESVSLIIEKEAKLAVKEVSADNLKQVVVEFNSESLLDEEAAAKVANYALEDSDGDEVEIANVSVDGAVATITLKAAVENQDVLELTVKSALLGKDEKFEVEFFDTTIPTVVGAEVVGERTVKVKFSEPIDFASASDAKDAFEFNDGEYFVKGVTPLTNGTVANVELYSSLDEGDLKVEVDNSLEDYAGFNVVPKTITLTVVEDEEEPEVIGYKDATRGKVTLIFNEDIQLASNVTKDDFYHTNSANDVDVDIDTTKSGEQLGAVVSGNELTLHFSTNQLPEGTAYIYIDGSSVLDLWGNKNTSTIRTKVEVEVDETNPKVDEIKVIHENEIKVVFTEDIKASSVDKDDFTLLDKDGKEAKLVRRVTAGSDFVTILFTKNLSGNYSLVVEGIDDLAGNEIDEVTVDFKVNDLTQPIIKDFSAVLYFAAGKNNNADVPARLVINFGEAMSVDGKYSVLDLEKYDLANVELADLDNAKIKATDGNKRVEITIPGDDADTVGLDLATNTQYTLGIARVADAAGNYSTKPYDTITVNPQGSVSMSTPTAITVNKVEVEFDDLFTDFESDDLAFYKGAITVANGVVTGGTKLNVARVTVSVNDDGNTVATYTLADDLTYTAKSNDTTPQAIQVVVVGNESVNRYGEALAKTSDNDGIKVVADEIAPVLESEDGVTLKDTSTTASAILVLDFTEDLTTDTFTDDLAATDFVVESNGKVLKANIDYTVAVSDDKIEITLTGDYDGKDITISTKATVNYITDINGNALAEIDGELFEVELP